MKIVYSHGKHERGARTAFRSNVGFLLEGWKTWGLMMALLSSTPRVSSARPFAPKAFLSSSKNQWKSCLVQQDLSPGGSTSKRYSCSMLLQVPRGGDDGGFAEATAAAEATAGAAGAAAAAGAAKVLVSEFTLEKAYDWTANLGAPAALVAGAVIATIYENLASDDMEPNENDRAWIGFAKLGVRLLLLSAFMLQMVCIFVTTVTGTMLLSREHYELDSIPQTASLGFLKSHFEFEYLTSRISFLQGLVHWLAAIGLEHIVKLSDDMQQHKEQSNVTMLVNRSIAFSILALIMMMLSFYNGHMTFFANYPAMLARYAKVAWERYYGSARVLPILTIPILGCSLYFALCAVRLVIMTPRDEMVVPGTTKNPPRKNMLTTSRMQ